MCCCFFACSVCYCLIISLLFSYANKASSEISKNNTFILLLHLILFLDHLDISLVGDSEWFQVLIHFPKFIGILLKSFLKLIVDFLNSYWLLFFFQLLHSLSHSFTQLFRSLLHSHNFLLIFSILFFQQIAKFLS